MFREEPLNKQIERLRSSNDTLLSRVQVLESRESRPVNVWTVKWGSLGWPTLMVVTAVMVSGLMIQARLMELSPSASVEVEAGTSYLFSENTSPTMLFSPRNYFWTETAHPTDWVLPEEELGYGVRDEGCGYRCGLPASNLVCETSTDGMSACHFESPIHSTWERRSLRFGHW